MYYIHVYMYNVYMYKRLEFSSHTDNLAMIRIRYEYVRERVWECASVCEIWKQMW